MGARLFAISNRSEIAGSRQRTAWLVAAAMGLVFLAAAIPLILTDFGHGTARADQNDYHLPVIRQFIAQWPRPDISNYDAAMTPGYHLLMAAIARETGMGERGLRLVSALFTCGLLLTFVYAISWRIGPALGVVLTLPLLCSQHVFSGGVWLVPHNAAWWGVLVCLLICLRPVVDGKSYVATALVMTLLVLFRQIHVWIALPLYVAAWIGSEPNRESGNLAGPTQDRSPHPGRLFRMILATLPAFIVLLAFYRLWGGAVPPMQRSNVTGGNAAVPGFFLALAGIYGLFFTPTIQWRKYWNNASAAPGTSLAVGAIAGLLIGVIPATSFSREAGRSGGLWNISAHLPAVAGRSPLIVVLAGIGGGILALWLAALPVRSRWIFAAALLAFVAAHSASGQAWQRYDEPFLLMLFPLMLAELARRDPQWIARRRAYIGPILLAVMLAGVTIWTLR